MLCVLAENDFKDMMDVDADTASQQVANTCLLAYLMPYNGLHSVVSYIHGVY